MGVIAWVVGGLIAGWLAGVAMKGGGYGRTGDVAVGLVGAFTGAWLFVFLVVTDVPNALAWEIVSAAIGAAAFIVVARLVTRRSARGSATIASVDRTAASPHDYGGEPLSRRRSSARMEMTSSEGGRSGH